MSHFDYKMSQQIAAEDYPFYALIMAAMRQADTGNAELLEEAFPKIWADLPARYNAPGGILPGEDSPHTEGYHNELTHAGPSRVRS